VGLVPEGWGDRLVGLPLGMGKSTGGVSTISGGRGGRYGVGLVPEGWGIGWWAHDQNRGLSKKGVGKAPPKMYP
jgi:hypothetical protein